MPSDDENQELQAALRTWVDEAQSHLSKNAQSSFAHYSSERWQLGEDGAYRRGEVSRLVLSREAVERLKQLPSYFNLKKSARGGP
jgi:hypothetical protein